jgi:hypothetical protein
MGTVEVKLEVVTLAVSDVDRASDAARRSMAEVKHVVVPSA